MDSAYVALGALVFTVASAIAAGIWYASNMATRLGAIETKVEKYDGIDVRLTKLEVYMENMSNMMTDIRDTIKSGIQSFIH